MKRLVADTGPILHLFWQRESQACFSSQIA